MVSVGDGTVSYTHLYEQHQKLKEQLDRVMEEWDAATVELENH